MHQPCRRLGDTGKGCQQHAISMLATTYWAQCSTSEAGSLGWQVVAKARRGAVPGSTDSDTDKNISIAYFPRSKKLNLWVISGCRNRDDGYSESNRWHGQFVNCLDSNEPVRVVALPANAVLRLCATWHRLMPHPSRFFSFVL